MRACLQRVSRASVRLRQQGELLTNGLPPVVGGIGHGLLVLLGIALRDTEQEARFLAKKCCELRIFEDEAGKMNRSLLDIQGAMLVVSQFTLYADCQKGRRPGFTEAAPPERANRLYLDFVQAVQSRGIPVETGVFQADMQVELLNDGPVTIWLDTTQIMPR